ncbi:hypothetical protein L9F63_010892, partial [Diploptera punctata]
LKSLFFCLTYLVLTLSRIRFFYSHLETESLFGIPINPNLLEFSPNFVCPEFPICVPNLVV